MNGERILFVDDEEMMVTMARAMLSDLGYTVTGMVDSNEAPKFIREKAFDIDLLITDQTMPGLSGIELVQEAHKIRRDLQIILCTGCSTEVDKMNIKEIGIQHVVLKPFRRNQIGTVIRTVMDKASVGVLAE